MRMTDERTSTVATVSLRHACGTLCATTAPTATEGARPGGTASGGDEGPAGGAHGWGAVGGQGTGGDGACQWPLDDLRAEEDVGEGGGGSDW